MSDVSQLDDRLPRAALQVWTNGRDYVVAVDENGAREFYRQHIGQHEANIGGLESADGWGPVPSEMPIAIQGDVRIVRSAQEWALAAGRGYLGPVAG